MAELLNDENKDKQITIRGTADDRQALEEIRLRVGLPMAEVVRSFAQNNRHRSRADLIGMIFGASPPPTSNSSHFGISLSSGDATELASISKQLGFNSVEDFLLETAKRALEAPLPIVEQFVYGRIRDRSIQEAKKEDEQPPVETKKRKAA